MAKKQALRRILGMFHSRFNSYWDDFQVGAITELEWTEIRENLFNSAQEDIEKLFESDTISQYDLIKEDLEQKATREAVDLDIKVLATHSLTALKPKDLDNIQLASGCRVCGCIPVNNERRCAEHAKKGDTLGLQIPVSPATYKKLKKKTN